MSGEESRQTPLPKGQLRDHAESERQRKTHSPRMVTYIPNCPLNAQTMHIFSRQDCILFHTPLSGGHISYFTHHYIGSALVICYVLKCTREKLKNSPPATKLVHPTDGMDGLVWTTEPVEDLQVAMRSQWASHPSNGTGGTAHWICTGKVQQEIKPTGQDPAQLSLAVLKQLGESHMGGHSQDPHKIIKLATLLPNRNGRVVNWIVVTTSRSTQTGLRSSLGNISLPNLRSQLRQELKKGPALIFITVYRHVVIDVGLTLKGQNGTAILTDIATQAIKLKGHRPASPLAVTVKNHLGAVRFIRSVSKLGWDLQQVFLTIGKLKLIQAAPGEPFLPFPREGVG